MRSSLVMSLIGATSMALALLVGCGDDDAKPTSSAVGQSCVRTADCADGLSCIANTCYKTAPQTGGNAGDSSMTPVPPKLGGEGESCTSRLDCAETLGCFNNRCTNTEPMGEGGTTGSTPVGVDLGTRGESCRVNGDCDKGLACVPSAVAGTGVCDLADYGLKPTGMTCTGECLADSDCYQLPLALHTFTIKSCEDVADAITTQATDCTAPVTPSDKLLCFEQATYCGYTTKSKTWTCDTDTNSCVYNTACVVAVGNDVPTGCPSFSRLRGLSALGLTCNADTLKCVGLTAAAACTTDAKCTGKQIVDSTLGDLCTDGECTCYTGNKQCYRKCARDIDCAGGQVCDVKKTKLCVPSPSCSSNEQCATANRSLAYVCADDGTCKEQCTTDHDCSPSGLALGAPFTGRVCGADKFCASLQANCSSDDQCVPAGLGGLKPFCVTETTATGTAVSSSITD